ncbi:MAG: hypothetical protein PVF04_00235 [Anaerolineae bacterium]|jgi:hypothetical protein
MNHIKVLERAWHTIWNYRALWLFGAVLALVTFSWGTAAIFDGADDWDADDWGRRAVVVTRQSGETFPEALRRTMREEVDEANRELSALFSTELGIGLKVHVLVLAAVLTGIAVIAYVVAKIARYVSETALIRMVGHYQETGERLRVGQGLRLGWSRSAWRLFLINLFVDILALLAGILLFALIFAPLPLWVNGSEAVIFAFAFLTGGLVLLAIAVVIVAATAVSVWKRLARQACALEGLRVTESIGRGWRILWQHLKDAGLMWLITFGVHLGWSVAIVPVVLLLLGAGLMIAGLPAVAAGGLAGLVATADAPVFVGLALGIPIFLLVLVAPLVFLGGLREVFVSSLWTFTYRQLQHQQGAEPAPLPALGPSGLEAAPAA